MSIAEPLVLLAVHAHPDDESIGTGGTLARYGSEGIETVLVVATKGEAGDVLNPSLDPRDVPDISRLRLKELEAACEILGIHRVHFLGYRDSGMAGAASNAHPEALVNADLQEAAGRLVGIIREARPSVVLTYNERGFYGHPDHIAVNRITLSAVGAAGNPSQHPHLPWPAWRPEKLYYTAVPRSRLLGFKQILEERGEKADFDLDALGTPDDAITAWIDVGPYVDQKLRAIYSHRSQIGPRSFVSRIPEPMRREALSMECYVRVGGGPDGPFRENDLFEGIRHPSPPHPPRRI